MADFTINDTQASIRYEYDDRFIYNDIRSSIGVQNTETVVDSDPSYAWKQWTKYHSLPAPGYTTYRYYEATVADPLSWKLENVTCYDYDYNPYSGFQIQLVTTNNDNERAVEVTNTGTKGGTISYTVKYRYLASEQVTHEELVYDTLMVRAVDAESIAKYGRRTMNLVWPVGVSESTMQKMCERMAQKYAEPAARLTLVIKGKDDTLRGYIYSAELSNDVAVVCANLGLNDTFYLDSIRISGTPDGIPVATWGLTDKYATETQAIIILNTSTLNSSDVLG